MDFVTSFQGKDEIHGEERDRYMTVVGSWLLDHD